VRSPIQRGFGPVDLLVVLAILSLGAALVLPVVRKAQTKSSLAQCTANLQQIGRAVLAYAEDHKGAMPSLENAPAPGSWWYYKDQVKGYLAAGGSDRVFACPADRGYDEGAVRVVPFGSNVKYNRTSYVFYSVNLHGIANIADWPLPSINDPAQTLLAMDWTAHAPLSWHNSRTGQRNTPFYNNAESVVAFVDGHVKFIPIYYDGINAAYTRDPIAGYEYKYSGN